MKAVCLWSELTAEIIRYLFTINLLHVHNELVRNKLQGRSITGTNYPNMCYIYAKKSTGLMSRVDILVKRIIYNLNLRWLTNKFHACWILMAMIRRSFETLSVPAIPERRLKNASAGVKSFSKNTSFSTGSMHRFYSILLC